MRQILGCVVLIVAWATTSCSGSAGGDSPDTHAPSDQIGADTKPADTAGPDLAAADQVAVDTPRTDVPAGDNSLLDHSGDTDVSQRPTPRELAGRVEKNRLQADLEFVAKPRQPGSPHWQAVQDLCAQRLEELGFQVALQPYNSGVNVVGTLLGKTLPDEIVLISAHYDHIAECDGADDNATGVAGALEAARVLSQQSFDRTLVVAFWDEEEEGLLGSQYYAKTASSQNQKIITAYVFEMIGYSSDEGGSQTLPFGFEFLFPTQTAEVKNGGMKGNFLAVISDNGAQEATASMDLLGQELGLPVIVLDQPLADMLKPALGDLQRSDHAAFWFHGYSAMMITDTSEFRYPNYHCSAGPDSVDLLDLDFMTSVVAVTVGSAAGLLRP